MSKIRAQHPDVERGEEQGVLSFLDEIRRREAPVVRKLLWQSAAAALRL